MNNNLKLIREAFGMTIQQLSDATGISRVTLSRYENGQKDLRYCRAETLIRIADALEIVDVRMLYRRLPDDMDLPTIFWT